MPQITMLENVWNGATLLGAGSAVTVSTELADALVGAGKAMDSSGYRGVRVDQTMTDDVQRAAAAAVVGAGGRVLEPHAYSQMLARTSNAKIANVRNFVAAASTNEPVEIPVRYDQGVCPNPAYLRVKNSLGADVAFQWVPAVHPVVEADISKWPDGSVRQGSVMFLATIGASATLTYSVEVADTEGVAGAQNVVFGEESATVNYLQTAKLRTRFAQDRAWIPKSLRDPSRSLAEFSGTGNLLHARLTLAGVNKFSYTVADITNLTQRRLGTDNFGYGVVFQEIESNFFWAAAPTCSVRTRIRQFANNSFTFEQRFFQGDAFSSGNNGYSTYINANDAALTSSTPVIDHAYSHYTYSDGRKLVAGFVTYQAESPNFQPTGENNLSTVLANEIRLGYAKDPAVIPAGAFFTITGYISVDYDTAANEVNRRHLPLIAKATEKTIPELKEALKSNLLRLAAAWLPVEAADTADYVFGGTNGLVRLAIAKARGLPPPVAEALALFQRWAAERGINPLLASSYFTQWSSLGWEFIGPGTGGLLTLHKELTALGDTEVASLVETYIHAVADFAVLAEVDSGGAGQMKLRGSSTDNYNAEASAMSALCDSLSLAADATRLATLGRIATRFVTSYQIGGKTPYDFQATGSVQKVIQFMRAAYHFYNVYAAIRAHRTYPCLPSQIDYRAFSLQYFVGEIADEYRWNKQHTRRGLPSNQMSAAYAVALGGAPDATDWQHAYDLIRHLSDKLLTAQVCETVIDGHVGTFDGTLAAAWGGSDAPAAAWHLLYELSAE